ncbi:hypothetical protein HDU96_002843 [Phlyctochytrium bullatum]|nr:hypothetical protein HDU96_002843 [Phlyctochytrium bullatum]
MLAKVKRSIPKYLVALFILFPIVATFIIVAGVLTAENEKDKNDPLKSVQRLGSSSENLPISQVAPTSTDICESRNFFTILLVVTGIDVTSNSFKVSVRPVPCGDFAARDEENELIGDGQNLIPSYNVSLYIASKVATLEADKSVPQIEYVFPFYTGSPNNYPFDRYTLPNIWIGANYENQTSGKFEQAEVAVAMDSLVSGFQLKTSNVAPIAKFKSVTVDIEFRRARLTLVFSVFVMTIMWMLALLGITFTALLLAYGRKSEPPVIAFSVAMLFALPGVRNTQPGAPPVGCTSDLISFFWVMMIIALNVGLLIFNFIYRSFFVKDPPAAPAAPAADKPAAVADKPAPAAPAPSPSADLAPMSSSPTAASTPTTFKDPANGFPSSYDNGYYYQSNTPNRNDSYAASSGAASPALVPPVRTRSAAASDAAGFAAQQAQQQYATNAYGGQYGGQYGNGGR